MHKSAPLFSIIIPYYQGERFIERCLHSIYVCSLYTNYEIIIVDDASPDPITQDVKKKHSKVRFVRNRKNKGFVRTINHGASYARGTFFLFLNMDTEIIASGWLLALKNVFLDQQVAICGGKLLYPDSNLIQHVGIAINGTTGELERLYYKAPAFYEKTNYARNVDAIDGAFYSVRKTIFKRFKGFSIDYHSGHEDVDLCFKATRAGFHVRYVPEIVIYHHELVTGLTNMHAFHSRMVLHKKWGSLLRKGELRYYEKDGFSKKFVDVLSRITNKEFFAIINIIDVLGLHTKERQRLFVQGKDTLSIIDELLAAFTFDKPFWIRLLYYKLSNVLALRRPLKEVEEVIDAIISNVDTYELDDDTKILLFMLQPDKFSYRARDFKNKKYFDVYVSCRRILKNTYSFNMEEQIYTKGLLVTVLSFILRTINYMPEKMMLAYSSFIRSHENYFEDKEALISYYFSIATRDDCKDKEGVMRVASGVITRHQWPRDFRIKFYINRGSVCEGMNEYAKALVCFRKGLALCKNIRSNYAASIYFHCGVCLAALSRFAEAEKSLRACKKIIPEHKKAQMLLNNIQCNKR